MRRPSCGSGRSRENLVGPSKEAVERRGRLRRLGLCMGEPIVRAALRLFHAPRQLVGSGRILHTPSQLLASHAGCVRMCAALANAGRSRRASFASAACRCACSISSSSHRIPAPAGRGRSHGPTQCHPRPKAVSHTLARRTDQAARVISGGGCSVHARRKLGKNAVHLGARFLLDLRSCTRGGARSLAVSWPQLVRPIQTHSSRMVL